MHVVRNSLLIFIQSVSQFSQSERNHKRLCDLLKIQVEQFLTFGQSLQIIDFGLESLSFAISLPIQNFADFRSQFLYNWLSAKEHELTLAAVVFANSYHQQRESIAVGGNRRCILQKRVDEIGFDAIVTVNRVPFGQRCQIFQFFRFKHRNLFQAFLQISLIGFLACLQLFD